MNESYDPATHILVIAFIVFYWHLLRIWHRSPPSDHGEKDREKKSVAELEPKFSGVALRQVATPPAHNGLEQKQAPALPSGDALDAIRAMDDRFDEMAFQSGASHAYELVINAYARGDTEILDDLLDHEAAKVFKRAIAERQARDERLALVFIGIKKMKIVHAGMEANVAEITVRFDSELIVATHSADGAVVDGDPDRVVEMSDLWTFARNVKSRDPNWKLVATERG